MCFNFCWIHVCMFAYIQSKNFPCTDISLIYDLNKIQWFVCVCINFATQKISIKNISIFTSVIVQIQHCSRLWHKNTTQFCQHLLSCNEKIIMVIIICTFSLLFAMFPFFIYATEIIWITDIIKVVIISVSLNRISKGIEKDNLQTEVPQCQMFPKYNSISTEKLSNYRELSESSLLWYFYSMNIITNECI